ncbi:MAG: tRNA (guanine(10)-N(2))-dimethyltransferase [Halobacteriaceae archaeon]
MRVSEGEVELSVPEQQAAGVGDAVFFNPRMELNRDVTVAALSAYRDNRDPAAETYLDAMAATGARGVRAAAEGWSVTLVDRDEAATERCRANLQRNDLDGEVLTRDVRAVLADRPGRFDVIDLDPFGTPMPFADAALRTATGLVCVTATDTAPLCGAHMASGRRHYDCVPRNTEYHAEMSLRVLLSALARTAAVHDVGVEPVLSHVSDHYVRTYLVVHHRATDADEALDELGHVYHCRDCLWRDDDPGRLADPPSACPHCGTDAVLTAGPIWVGPTADDEFVAATRDRLRPAMGTADRAGELLDRIGAELDVPTHYDHHELTELWGVGAEPIDDVLSALRAAGHDATRTHYGGTTFKTTASRAALDEVLREDD